MKTYTGTMLIGGTLTKAKGECLGMMIDLDIESTASHSTIREFFFQVNSRADFKNILRYCTENSIAIQLKWDEERIVETWIDGRYHILECDIFGEYVLPYTSVLEAIEKNLSLEEFRTSLGIPEFPALVLP